MSELLGFISGGGIWTTPSVDEQPSLTLVRWQVMQLPTGERHFVGLAVENREGRVSTAVSTFDAASLRGITKSGRVYQLSGRPGHDGDAEYVWRAWARINQATEWADATAEVWAAHTAAGRAGHGEDEAVA